MLFRSALIYITILYVLWMFLAAKIGKSIILDIVMLGAGIWGFYEIVGHFV